MTKIKLLIGLMVLGLTGANAAPADFFVVNFKFTSMIQDLNNSGSPIEKSTIQRQKMTSKDIIFLLEEHYGGFGPDAILAMTSSGDFAVVDSTGAILANATSDGLMNNFFDDQGENVHEGTFNENTAKGNTTQISAGQIIYDDSGNGNEFTIHGLTNLHVSFDNNTGIFKGNINFTGQGDGELDFDSTVLSGSMSAHGSGHET
jgi:hypothetical protein